MLAGTAINNECKTLEEATKMLNIHPAIVATQAYMPHETFENITTGHKVQNAIKRQKTQRANQPTPLSCWYNRHQTQKVGNVNVNMST